MDRVSAVAPWAFCFATATFFVGIAACGILRGQSAGLSGIAAGLICAQAALSAASRLRSLL